MGMLGGATDGLGSCESSESVTAGPLHRLAEAAEWHRAEIDELRLESRSLMTKSLCLVGKATPTELLQILGSARQAHARANKSRHAVATDCQCLARCSSTLSSGVEADLMFAFQECLGELDVLCTCIARLQEDLSQEVGQGEELPSPATTASDDTKSELDLGSEGDLERQDSTESIVELVRQTSLVSFVEVMGKAQKSPISAEDVRMIFGDVSLSVRPEEASADPLASDADTRTVRASSIAPELSEELSTNLLAAPESSTSAPSSPHAWKVAGAPCCALSATTSALDIIALDALPGEPSPAVCLEAKAPTEKCNDAEQFEMVVEKEEAPNASESEILSGTDSTELEQPTNVKDVDEALESDASETSTMEQQDAEPEQTASSISQEAGSSQEDFDADQLPVADECLPDDQLPCADAHASDADEERAEVASEDNSGYELMASATDREESAEAATAEALSSETGVEDHDLAAVESAEHAEQKVATPEANSSCAGRETAASASASSSSSTPTSQEREPIPVVLHVYDVSQNPGVKWLNSVLAHPYAPLKFGGVFHVGVEIHGKEWWFGACPFGTGVASSKPHAQTEHHFRQTLEMPSTQLSKVEIGSVLRALTAEYTGPSYHLLRRNCVHFASEFCRRLGVGEIPGWLCRLADLGSEALSGLGNLEDLGALQLSRSCAGVLRLPASQVPRSLCAPPPVARPQGGVAIPDERTSRDGEPL